MSAKCRAYSVSNLGLEMPDNRKAFYAGWEAAMQYTKQKPTEEELLDMLLLNLAPTSSVFNSCTNNKGNV